MKKMTKFAAVLMAVAPALAMADGQPKVLQANMTAQSYVAAAKDDSLTTAEAWQGSKIVQLTGGACQKITHSNLRIEKAGDAEKATVEESASPVACPA
jgi:hypothetical protein